MKKYTIKLQRFPQMDFIQRSEMAFTQEEAVTQALDKYFAQNKEQKVKLTSCVEFIS